MKKIVSVLSVAALTLSAVFAADVSLNYKMAAALYTEKNEKTYAGNPAKETAAKQTRTILDLNGYADKPAGDLAFTAKNDFAGFALTLNPKVGTAYADDAKGFDVDTYYGWLNFSNVQVTTGKWCSRYVNRLDMHAGNWEGPEFERYKPGVINGLAANDIDNLTAVNKGMTNATPSADYEQRLSTAVAYTLHKDEDSALMIKGVLVDNDWGSTLRTDTKDDNKRAYHNKSYSDVDGGDLGFFSGFAGEFAYKTAGFDFNLALKSMYRDQLAFGAFFRTIGESSSLLFGLSAGLDLKSTKANGEKVVDHRYREFAFDFRGHFDLTEELCLTTMNNLSVYNKEKKDGQDYEEMDSLLWNMVSLGYKASEKVFAQLTAETECKPFTVHGNTAKDGTELDGPFSKGGFKITVTPGVVYSFNENATLTTGVALEWHDIGASPAYQDKRTLKSDGTVADTTITTSTIKIPVVFKVAL